MAIPAPLGDYSAPMPGDAQIVAMAARILRIREFEVFRLAYERWYGRTAAEAHLESVFMDYLFSKEAPCWVRHFTRGVIDARRRGQLDPTRFGLPPRAQPTARPVDAYGIGRYFLTVACITALILALLKVI